MHANERLPSPADAQAPTQTHQAEYEAHQQAIYELDAMDILPITIPELVRHRILGKLAHHDRSVSTGQGDERTAKEKGTQHYRLILAVMAKRQRSTPRPGSPTD